MAEPLGAVKTLSLLCSFSLLLSTSVLLSQVVIKYIILYCHPENGVSSLVLVLSHQ